MPFSPRLRNDLLCVEWDIKTLLLTDCVVIYRGYKR